MEVTNRREKQKYKLFLRVLTCKKEITNKQRRKERTDEDDEQKLLVLSSTLFELIQQCAIVDLVECVTRCFFFLGLKDAI